MRWSHLRARAPSPPRSAWRRSGETALHAACGACARSDLRTTLQDGERESDVAFSPSLSPSLLRNSRSPSRRHFSLVMNPPTSSGCSREPLAKQGESPKEGAWLDKVGSFHSFLELRFGVSLVLLRAFGEAFCPSWPSLPPSSGGCRRRRASAGGGGGLKPRA